MNEPTIQEPTEPLTGTTAEIYDEEPQGGQVTDPQSGQPDDGQQQQPQAQPQQQPATPSLTDDQIRTSVREGLREGLQTRESPKQYSPEELDKMFNVYQPTQELVDQVLAGGEGALKAFVALRDGLSKQFGTLLQYQVDLAKKELIDRYTPVESFATEAAAAKDRESFFVEHPDLKQHEKLCQTVFNALKAEGYSAKDKTEAYKTLADRTRALLPTANGNGTGATQSGGARTTTPTKRPAQLSSGSQAGGGGPSAPAAPFSGAEIWQE